MGGVKNKEEKKKAQHVYSSGGGSGGRGPAFVDKRSSLHPCPHCDRTFKQVQRYRDHLQSKHPEAAAAAEDGAEAQQAPALVAPAAPAPPQQGAFVAEKTPKMLLADWCQQNKRPRPRFRVSAAPAAPDSFVAKVVLPDGKDSEKDVVVFLDAAHAAGSEEEAAQRGAVAALARVAGERALHRVLPRAYRDLWQDLGAQAEERAARQARQAAAAEARRERDKARRAAEARRRPTAVIMSEHQRRMMQACIACVHVTPDGVAARLAGLGFAPGDVGDAMAAVAVSGAAGAAALEACLDWLCMHVPEGELPPAFGPGAEGRPVGVLHSTLRGALRPTAPAAASGDVTELAAFGYAPAAAAGALAACSGDADAALRRLFRDLVGHDCRTGEAIPDGADEPPGGEEWVEERMALEAIYAGDAAFPFERRTTLALDGGLVLDVRLEAGSDYPRDLPVLALRREGVPPEALRAATRALAAEAGRLVEASGRHVRGAPGRPRQRTNALLPEQAAAESRRLLARQREWQASPRTAAMRAARGRLPAAAHAHAVEAALAAHRVLVVSGATGCGKSTQVPQFVLDAAIRDGRGAECSIVCTQPRRISAVGVASRVAQERGESVGGTVGYSVRLDTRACATTRLLYSTTGVLLRRLQAEPGLTSVSHVVVDEVHERSVDTDLLLLLLRNLLACDASGRLRVVLMSATADVGLFAHYFSAGVEGDGAGGVGTLTIPGRTFPVRDLYLEDALELTGHAIGRFSRYARKGPFAKPAAAQAHPDVAGPQEAAVPEDWEARDGGAAQAPTDTPKGALSWALGSAGAAREYGEATRRSLAVVDEAVLNFELLEALVAHIVAAEAARGPDALLQGWESGSTEPPPSGDAGAILVFLPGAPEIGRAVRALSSSAALRRAAGAQRLLVLPLHGALPPAQQARVFERVDRGMRKIVVATNVAETSITIDDVTCVIDFGRLKEMRYDAARGIARLQETWVSLAAAQQRRGRAGRVRPGICFRLFSRSQAAALQEHQAPEVLRVPLQALCLAVKAAGDPEAPLADTLGRLLTPPEPGAVAAAACALTELGALSGPAEALTPLGRHLARLPCDARLGKALLYGAMLRCVGPVLTAAAAMAYGRPVFLSPHERRAEADAAKRALAAGGAAARSDHLAVVAAFALWKKARAQGGRQAAAQAAAAHFVSDAAMEAMAATRADFAAQLADLGFLPCSYARACAEGAHPLPPEAAAFDDASGNARIVKAALCAGFYPSILRVEHPAAVFAETHGGALEKDADPARLKFFDRRRGRVFIHPASVNFSCGSFPSGWLVYTDIVETSKVFVREASMVPVYALLLFGGSIVVKHAEGLLQIDGWVLKAPARIAVLVRELRQEVDRLLLQKVERPGLDLAHSPAVAAMHNLLATDGF
ncbi:hypothetical protein WJX81_001334 [Elliptochloris bilobata]|uniref:RNA helicase n=1 Tax=Elliptochloris bilobata TaxID=381761 RepID=A0AAW1SJ62_9CHLO